MELTEPKSENGVPVAGASGGCTERQVCQNAKELEPVTSHQPWREERRLLTLIGTDRKPQEITARDKCLSPSHLPHLL